MIEFVNAITSVQKIANDFSVGLTIKNARRQYFFANDYWLAAIGLEKEDVIGKTDDDFLSPENATLARELDAEAFSHKYPMEYSREVIINGNQIKYYVLKWIISFSNGEPFCLCTLSDLLNNKSKVLAFRDRIDLLFEKERQINS